MAEKTLITLTSPEGATLNTAGTYCEGNIEVVPKLQSKTATTGEIVTADDGYVGLESVDTNPAFEAGKKSEYDAFWDIYQNFGNRVTYQYAFAGDSPGWTEEIFRPKYDIILTTGYTATNIFWSCPIKDMVAHLESLGRKFDTSKVWYFNSAFQKTASKRWGVIDMSNGRGTSYAFAECMAETIEKLISNEGLNFTDCFYKCSYLVNLIVEGVIGQNGFNVSWSPLSKASIISVVNALSATTTGLTVTLRLSAVNTAFETSEGANNGATSDEWTALAATKSNWTINLIDS